MFLCLRPRPTPALLILNLSDKGRFYHGGAAGCVDEVNADTVGAFIEAFKAGALDPLSLSRPGEQGGDGDGDEGGPEDDEDEDNA